MTNKKISKNGQIGIPKQVRKQVNIQNGDFLTIYYDNEVLVVEKWDNQHHNQLNQCIFSNGRVSIPIELRRIHNIELDFPLTMEISNKKIFFKAVITSTVFYNLCHLFYQPLKRNLPAVANPLTGRSKGILDTDPLVGMMWQPLPAAPLSALDGRLGAASRTVYHTRLLSIKKRFS